MILPLMVLWAITIGEITIITRKERISFFIVLGIDDNITNFLVI
jgi:hypothetical protein